MDPSKKGSALAAKVSDLIARDVRRQTVPVDGEDDDQQEQQHQPQWRDPEDAPPPPYETSSAASASASWNPGTAVPSSSRPSGRELGDADGPRSSCSSFGEDDTAGLRGGEGGYLLTPRPRPSQGQRDDDDIDGGYARTDPMSAETPGRWESRMGTPGCCFSDSGGCCFSSRGGCCFSDRGGGCCSDTEGCCFSTDGACCCSGSSGGGRPQL
ncbi:hypothetical protein LZ30DRAFT_727249 [Colletotrichum cereale]|nr:hypothetical protein LZ30DRAFT_727249 [Colletotrichum cereale]